MRDNETLLDIIKTALGTFDYRQSFSPGMFEPLKPLFHKLGYTAAAVYIAEDYPDRMRLQSLYGDGTTFPEYIPLDGHASLNDCLRERLSDVPNLLTGRLFSHGRELGALAVIAKNSADQDAREAFAVLAQSMSIMAYIERIRTNSTREREERDIFFSQSLTSRLLIANPPAVKNLRIGIEFIRTLEARGDFYDFVSSGEGKLRGFFGCCNGRGLRTVLEVTSIMREVHRAAQMHESPAAILKQVNRMLVDEKKRAHQASLCFFDIDCQSNSIRLAKAGYLGLLLCGPGSKLQNISTFGSLFLGMAIKPKIHDETFAFEQGNALFGVTEGFYSSRNCLGAQPQMHWFLSALASTLEMKRKKPLVKQLFENLDNAADLNTKPTDALLALSVERTAK